MNSEQKRFLMQYYEGCWGQLTGGERLNAMRKLRESGIDVRDESDQIIFHERGTGFEVKILKKFFVDSDLVTCQVCMIKKLCRKLFKRYLCENCVEMYIVCKN